MSARRSFVVYLYGPVLALWAASWNFRLSVLLSWSPVEPVWLATGLFVLAVAHRLTRPVVVPPGVLLPLVLVTLSFLPGAIVAGDGGYAPEKIATLLLVILPAVMGAVLLLDSREALVSWLASLAVLGVVVAVACQVVAGASPDSRLTLPTVETIATARPVGAACVVLLLAAFSSSGRLLLAAAPTVLCVVVLVHIGSRGPAVYVIVSTLLAVLVCRYFRRHRRLALLGTAAAAAAAYGYALGDGGAGGSRIIGSARDGFSDEVRGELLRSALGLGLSHPWGIGWGEFGRLSPIGVEVANSQGVAYAHNLFAEAWAEGGVVALVGMVVLVVAAGRRILAQSRTVGGALLFGTFCYWLLNAQVSSDLVGNKFLWITLAAGLVAGRSLGRDAGAGTPPGVAAPQRRMPSQSS